ncbi:TraB/GumN family protein [Altererythrobacter sp.]|nr:TraB/GumN family protein [Altererythrobacter sp.]
MTVRAFLAGFAALLLAACGEPPGEEVSNASAPPLIWEVASANGQVEGWLYGTIHALPDGSRWRNPLIETTIDTADYLVVEVAALEDGEAISRAFMERAQSPGHPFLWRRVKPGLREDVAELVAKTPYSPADFQQIESWAAALILAQASTTTMESENGVDKALIRDFADRRIVELEGAERQFEIFDALAESDQREMLTAVIEEADQNAESIPQAAALWLAGDEEGLARETRRGILADPEIYQALLVDRNRNWVAQVVTMFRRAPKPLVAVGAAHLVGDDSLVALLEARGYTVRRLR